MRVALFVQPRDEGPSRYHLRRLVRVTRDSNERRSLPSQSSLQTSCRQTAPLARRLEAEPVRENKHLLSMILTGVVVVGGDSKSIDSKLMEDSKQYQWAWQPWLGEAGKASNEYLDLIQVQTLLHVMNLV
jgi:hypothetical protein